MARDKDKNHEQSPADVQEYLKGVDYPATKDDLIAAARNNGAPDSILDILQRLPGDRFEGPPGVMKAYGQIR
ncbi:MAG: DUF2795 domain-containing protein [Isosphaeraceae bacterium]|nr:DUF2795 domain-containing protein [Isosphaeraceae bacterium]